MYECYSGLVKFQVERDRKGGNDDPKVNEQRRAGMSCLGPVQHNETVLLR